uniref:Latent transforming growth factor beta binding protein 1 n=1 Tax=Felis catus TaxID=9685 RepID=A0ABI7WUP5_FELCA
MAGPWLRWGLLLWAGLLASSAHGRVRRITYVVRPGPGLAAGALPLGGPPRPRTFNVALDARYSRGSAGAGAPSRASPGAPSERTRRTSQPGGAAMQGLRPPPPPEPARPGAPGGQLHPKPGAHPAAAPFAKQGRQVVRSKVPPESQSGGGSRLQVQQKQQLQGVNVCGGQCCHGWSKAPGSQRCTKPSCVPPCQNGGMCLRPQLCVCKPGTKGKACETAAAQDTSSPGFGGQSLAAASSWVPPEQAAKHTSSKKADTLPRVSPVAQMTLTLKPKPSVGLSQQIHSQVTPLSSQNVMIHHGQTQEYVLKPKYFTAQKVISGEQSTEVSNHTGRIKVVFTPSICKVTCTKGSCQNSCEKGNTTTLISENGHAADTLTATNFRVVICHLPCMNGGQCSSRDKCQCPPNFTGKLCQIPVHGASVPKLYQHSQQSGKALGTHVVHSTHTLPLTMTSQQGVKVKFPPNIVNIHVKHPPEASVQIHQVSRIDGPTGQKTKEAQAGQSQISYQGLPVQKTQTVHSTYSHQQVIPHVYPVAAKTQLGRCFQETIGSQCGKALPGLSKQEDCCGTVGTSWGFNKCQKCPKKPSYHGYNQMMECLQGYKRVNNTFCQDINECQLQGVCPNGECLNTMGSYRCTCKMGFGPDPTFSSCVPDTPVISEEKGPCYRLVSSGRQCMHPLSVHLTKQLCCCSVGKAWGPHCEKCPLPGTAKEEPVEALTFSREHGPGVAEPEVATAPPEKEIPSLDQEKTKLEPGQPQLSPGISTIHLHPQFPVVIEKTSPPVPVEVAPEASTSSASQVIAPTQVTEINECTVNPDICGAGHCINLPVRYTCICYEGYKFSEQQRKCVDIDECSQVQQLCSQGRCENTEGSFLCICPAGFMASEEGPNCIDVDECLRPDVCGEGHCINTVGAFRCEYCDSGYRMTRGGRCEDIDECLTPSTCPDEQCVNSPGSYQCVPCTEGFRGWNGQCLDVDECLDPQICTNGTCSNLEGSYMCSCHKGYSPTPDHKHCKDINECLEDKSVCQGGDCINTEGSYDCTCPDGFQLNDNKGCQDINECEQPGLCDPHGECLNTDGSFHCVCEQGFSISADGRTCEDIDECVNNTVCDSHGFCDNTAGSFRCLCYQGFQAPQDGQGCVDVNECELLSGVCGEAFCENVEGSFLCVCADENQEYSPMTGECRSRASGDLDDDQPKEEKKECYYNLNDASLCDNVLAPNVTKQECCCTSGAGWGDNCEIFPCPVVGTAEFAEMCPRGKGFVPTGESSYDAGDENYKDADECLLFGQEICKNGFCLNTQPGYECYCKQGTYYDPVKLQCFDMDECQDPNSCIDGQCVNTEGSYNCFCTHPMVLDASEKRCIRPTESHEQIEETDVYQDLCWEHLSDEYVCSRPLVGKQTTYTECCCLYGEAWGMQCALCPMKDSDDYAQLCNIPVTGRRRPYGRDALVDFSEQYAPEADPYFIQDRFLNSFEELQAEECGILNGCENGRCVRVQEGYTCDCFDGYHLDMAKMTCVDVNECDELNNRMSLCKNAKCINTEGSYKCVCLPGYVPSDKPNYCTPLSTALNLEKDSDLE